MHVAHAIAAILIPEAHKNGKHMREIIVLPSRGLRQNLSPTCGSFLRSMIACWHGHLLKLQSLQVGHLALCSLHCMRSLQLVIHSNWFLSYSHLSRKKSWTGTGRNNDFGAVVQPANVVHNADALLFSNLCMLSDLFREYVAVQDPMLTFVCRQLPHMCLGAD